MNELELIRIEEHKDFPVDARDLHEFLGVSHRFNDWIVNRLSEYPFVEDEDYRFYSNFSKTPTGGRPPKDYMISLDMAKELSMVEKTEKGRRVRKYFIQKEKELQLAKKNILELEMANSKLVEQTLRIECSSLKKQNRALELDIISERSINKIRAKLVDDMYKELRRVENYASSRKNQ